MLRASIPMIVLICCVPLTAAADDDAPYSPHHFSVGELVITDRFDEPPLAFPWNQVASERSADRGRMDFELVYDVDYTTVRDDLQEAYDNAEGIITLEDEIFGYVEVDDEEMHLAGIGLQDDGGRITVGHPDMEPMFLVDVEPDGSRTRFTIHNSLRSRQFSGFVPSRVEFQPAGADPVPFRMD